MPSDDTLTENLQQRIEELEARLKTVETQVRQREIDAAYL